MDRLAPYGEVVLYGTEAACEEELIERLAGAVAAINVRGYSRIDARLLAALPELRAISILDTGTGNVDLDAATRHGTLVSNAPGRPRCR